LIIIIIIIIISFIPDAMRAKSYTLSAIKMPTNINIFDLPADDSWSFHVAG